MKRAATILDLMRPSIMVLLAVCSAGQTVPSGVTEPEFGEVFFRLSGNSLLPLERQTTTAHSSVKGVIVMSMKTSAEFPGGKSPVRFRAHEQIDLVVRSILTLTMATDPNSIYGLRRLETKKSKRQIVMMSGHATPFGASMNAGLMQGTLPLTFTRYGEPSLRVNVGELPPGEYAITKGFGPSFFCFGVD